VTTAPDSTNPNATRGGSWCSHYVVAASRLVPLPASPLPPAAELLPEWLKRSKPLTHPLPLPADGPRQPRQSSPDGLKTAAQAAAKLNCSIKTLFGHVASGALRYVDVGHGKKRRRIRFTDADLNEFIANQTRKDVPCPSTRTETAARRISTSTSKCEVIGFTARRDARRGVKPKK
jgi:hypothetical protein